MSSISPGLTPQAFVDKWRHTELKERAACQEHFLDLCHLIGHPTPAADDPTGEHFAFEYGLAKQDGGQGFADVFKRGYFGWEYKGKHANLDKAYGQLLQYRSDLLNPPLLVVCDMDRIIVHTNFTNTVHRVHTIALNDLLTGDGLQKLRAIFTTPDFFKAAQTTEQVTQEAAAQFAQLADRLRHDGTPPQDVAHFLIRCLFCLFAEDAGLLPDRLFTRIVTQARQRPPSFAPQCCCSCSRRWRPAATSGPMRSGTLTAACSIRPPSTRWMRMAWKSCGRWPRWTGRASSRRSSARCSRAASIRRSARSWAHSTPAKRTFC